MHLRAARTMCALANSWATVAAVSGTLRVNDRRRAWPGDADHGGHAVGFDQLDRELIVVDLVAGQRSDGGGLGQAEPRFRLGPGSGCVANRDRALLWRRCTGVARGFIGSADLVLWLGQMLKSEA